jgi:hypothetical protein
MAKLFRIWMIAIILGGLTINLAAPVRPLALEEQKSEVVVVYKNDVGKRKILDKAEGINDHLETLKAINVVLTESNISTLRNDPDVSYIELKIEQKVRLLGTSGQWNVEAINAPKAWEEGVTGQDVKVAIIDSGVAEHAELPNVVKRLSFIEDDPDTENDESSPLDNNGHGTHVAGIVGANIGGNTINGKDIVGVAPNAAIYSIKVMDGNQGTVMDLIEAIDWAIANKMDIINLSLGLPTHVQLLQDAVDRAYQSGILLVGAAGNDGNETPVNYPAKYDSVIAVSSVDRNGIISDFSSTGEEIEFSAPGSNYESSHIISTYPSASYIGMAGTSQAAPHVAGFAALLMQKNPDKTAVDIRRELRKYVEDFGVEDRDRFFGYGFINYLSFDGNPPMVPTINEVADSSTTINGKTDPHAVVTLYFSKQFRNNTKADLNGNYNFIIDKQKAGTEIKVTATDKAGNVSVANTVKVIDKTPPAAPTLNTIADNSTSVSGKTEPYAIVNLYISGQYRMTTTADQYGNYKFTINKQKAGTEIKVTAMDKGKNVSGIKSIRVIDKTAPSITSLNTVANNSTAVAGKAEAYATMRLYISGKYQKYTTADKYGSYRFTINRQPAGSEIKVTATDKAGNVGLAKIVRVIDKIAPAVPTLKAIADNSTVATGKTEPYSTVKLYISGKYHKSTRADKYGNYKMTITRQRAGTEVKVTAVDKAGNSSAIRKLKVLDKTAPAVPALKSIANNSTVAAGKTEAYAKLKLYISGKYYKSTTANKYGNYKFVIKKQRAGTEVKVSATDKFGNISKFRRVKVIDKVAPAAPSVNKVTKKSKAVLGKTEKYATVYVYMGKSRIGKVTANKNGYYKVKIKPRKKGTKLNVYAVDKSANKSKSKVIKVY